MIKKSSKGAMEMSVGTIVTIVLLVSVLVLGLILIKNIFGGATSAVDLTNQQLTDQINQLFSQDTSTQVVIYPQTGQLQISKGNEGAFGFSIRNTDTVQHTFSYNVSVIQIANGCQMSTSQAQNLIILGGSGSNYVIPSGSSLNQAIPVRFSIPNSASLCDIRYGLNIDADGQQYVSTIPLDLQIT